MYVKNGYKGVLLAVNIDEIKNEGFHIVKVNEKCKAIVNWKKPINGSYYEKDGKQIKYSDDNAETEEILKGVEKVSVYNTNGKKIFETERVFEEACSVTFKIKFGEKTVTCIEMSSIYGGDHTIYKDVYNYDGQKLLSKKQEITNEDILNKVNAYDNELSI